ncbi:MAG: Maf family nucleotide pyrophosphatase [Salibacteraceae bacterium]
MIERLNQYEIILASQSPRRKMLFEALGMPFTIKKTDVDEGFPEHLKRGAIPEYLANKKANAALDQLKELELLVTADTVVWINDHALNKPTDLADARKMLKEISGNVHSVFTGVCLATINTKHSFFEETKVHFNSLSDAEIEYYLKQHQPLDKAGAYGIQEFIGLIGIKYIEGDFYNVVGFPMQRFWNELKRVI